MKRPLRRLRNRKPEITNEARDKVSAIEEKAKACGWTHDQLWKEDGDLSKWGFVCFIGAKNQQVGEVCPEYIEVIVTTGTDKKIRQKFYNHKII